MADINREMFVIPPPHFRGPGQENNRVNQQTARLICGSNLFAMRKSAPPQPADFSALLSCRCSASGSARAAPRRRNRVDGGPGLLGIQTSAIWPAVAGGCEMTLRVAIGGFGAIGKVVAERLDRGIEGLTLAAVSARDTVRAAAAMAGFAGPMRRLPL